MKNSICLCPNCILGLPSPTKMGTMVTTKMVPPVSVDSVVVVVAAWLSVTTARLVVVVVLVMNRVVLQQEIISIRLLLHRNSR